MKKVFIVAGSLAYRALFQSLGFTITQVLDEANLICFTGGEDVTPSLYGDVKHRTTHNSPERDEYEKMVFLEAQKKNIPCVGICRGAQFLNVMSGGRMYQHVSEHTRSHLITDVETGDTIYVSSTHHQMMMPSPSGLLVASSRLGGTREWFDGDIAKRDVSQEDIEVVYYQDTNCLCFQPHPEFTSPEYGGMRKYFQELVERYLVV